MEADTIYTAVFHLQVALLLHFKGNNKANNKRLDYTSNTTLYY
jgi:hypothetical protein